MAVLNFEDAVKELWLQQGGFLYFYIFSDDGSIFSFRNVVFLAKAKWYDKSIIHFSSVTHHVHKYLTLVKFVAV